MGNNTKINLKEAKQLLREQKYDEALDKYNTWSDQVAKKHLGIGEVHKARKELDLALTSFEKAFELDKNDEEIILKWVKWYQELQKYSQAQTILNRLFEIQPESYHAHLFQGNLYQAQGLKQEALDSYDKAWEIRKEYDEAVIQKVRLQIKEDNHEEANQIWTNFIAKCPTSKAYAARADLKRDWHNYKGAYSDIEQAVKLNTANKEYIGLNEAILAYYAQKFENARAKLEWYVDGWERKENEKYKLSKYNVLLFYLGSCYRNLKTHNKAAEYYQKYLDYGGKENEEYWLEKAKYEYENKRYEKSMEYVEESLEYYRRKEKNEYEKYREYVPAIEYKICLFEIKENQNEAENLKNEYKDMIQKYNEYSDGEFWNTTTLGGATVLEQNETDVFGNNWNTNNNIIKPSPDIKGKEIILGKGGFGIIKKVFVENNWRAVKEMKNISDDMYKAFLDEIKIWMDLEDDNVIKIYGYQGKKVKGEKIIEYQMEYCDGGDVSKLLKSNPTVEVKYRTQIAKQWLSGLNYLHRSKVLHGDLKCENLLLLEKYDKNKTPQIKICDFGIGTKQTGEEKAKGCTLNYAAPEYFWKSISKETDIYAFGMTLYELFTGKRPFDNILSSCASKDERKEKMKTELNKSDAEESRNKIVNEADIPNKIKDIIKSCIKQKSEDRAQYIGILTPLNKFLKELK